MIRKVFVVKESGVWFFNQTLAPSPQLRGFEDITLVSGFFSATMSFFHQATGGQIKRIVFDDFVLVFYKKDQFYFIILCDLFDSHHYLIRMLDTVKSIADTFLAYYPFVKEEDIGTPHAFRSFAEILPEIVEEKFNSHEQTEISSQFLQSVIRDC